MKQTSVNVVIGKHQPQTYRGRIFHMPISTATMNQGPLWKGAQEVKSMKTRVRLH